MCKAVGARVRLEEGVHQLTVLSIFMSICHIWKKGHGRYIL